MPGGRPRTFEVGEALDRASEVFWRQGYEGTSVADLTVAMGVNKPSLYKVFGTKEEVFRKAVDRYAERNMAYALAALDQPTAYEVARAFLLDNVANLTRPGCPPGCLTIQGAISVGPSNRSVAEFLAANRLAGEKMFADRFAQAIADGDLCAEANPSDLARYLMVVSEGHAVHAGAGISRSELEQSVEIALRALAASGSASRPGSRASHR